MKLCKSLIYILALTGIFMAGGCIDDLSLPDEEAPDGAALRITTGSSFTRSDEDAEDDPYQEGEDALKRVTLFFFDNIDSESEAFYVWEKEINEVATADLTVKVPIELIDKFPEPSDTQKGAYVYAVVNLPSDVKVDADEKKIGGKSATMENIRQVWVDEPLFTNAGAAPATFVMRGGKEVGVTKQGNLAYVTGRIMLERLASKIRLWADIPEYIYLDENGKTITPQEGETHAQLTARATEVWKSEPLSGDDSNVILYMYNAATRARIDAATGSKEDRDGGLLGYDNVDRSSTKETYARKVSKKALLVEADKDENYPYSHTIPYYSYPNEWDRMSPTEKNESYVIVALPWTCEKGKDRGVYERCYYQIPINALGKAGSEDDANVFSLRPNQYYRIKLKIGMLGARDLGEAQEVRASYEVVDWVTNDVNVTIKDRRFLVVNQHEWTMNNVEEIEIPFSSSHDAVVAACYVTYFRYKDAWGTQSEADESKNEFTYWQQAADGTRSSTKNETGGHTGEGILEGVRFDSYNDNVLYYKKEYFYDEVKRNYDYYYVGREHPKTYDYRNNKIVYNEAITDAKYQQMWKAYNDKYKNINAIYTCTANNETRMIKFTHPMIQWHEVRTGNSYNGYDLAYYYPEERIKYIRTGTGTSVGVTQEYTGDVWDEFSRCEIVIKLKHKDRVNVNDGLYEETIYITQYPGIYIDVSHNYGTPRDSGNEYVFVNDRLEDANGNAANPSKATDNGPWWGVHKLADFRGSNSNPNMYIITTTQLSPEDEDEYDIGDPRTIYRHNLLKKNQNSYDSKSENNVPLEDNSDNETWFPVRKKKDSDPNTYDERTWKGTNQQGSAQYNEEVYNVADNGWGQVLYKRQNGNKWGRLQYYYPTDETPRNQLGSKETFIAPSFRIASSFGVITINHRVEMRRRCASYQEAGRPAGRWRLPTKAEVKFIATLSAEGKIPILFGSTVSTTALGYYWTATGGLVVSGSGIVDDNSTGDNNTGAFAVRCVYDEWYWNRLDKKLGYKLDPQQTEFIWGDMPKDNTQADLPKD